MTLPRHDGSSGNPVPENAPTDLGELRSGMTWRDPFSFMEQLLPVVIIGLFVPYAFKRLFLHSSAYELRDLGGIIAFGVLAWWVFRPASHSSYIGQLGIATTESHQFKRDRAVLMFHRAASVDVALTRVISDGISQIYSHTDVTFTWRDEGGAPVYVIATTLREPDQVDDWGVRAELDPGSLVGLPPEHPAVFANAAMHEFRDYIERQQGPYR